MKFDVVIIGGGLSGVTAGLILQKAGRSCCVVSEGMSLNPTPKEEYVAAGGTFLPGDSVVSGVWDGLSLKAVFTRNLESTPLEAVNFILATGKFFSRGLVATMDEVLEPLFGADVEFDSCRERWYEKDFFAPQPFERFGVKTSPSGQLLFRGEPATNLYAVGEVLAGDVDVVKSAEDVCRNII